MKLREKDVAIQAAGLAEIPLLAALQAACFGDAAGSETHGAAAVGDSGCASGPDDSAWSEPALAGLLAGPGCFGLIALRDGDPAGFALARRAADECELLSLGVLPAQRRLGIGRALLAAVCGRAAGAGVRHVYLEVAADNWAARALYEAQGFQPSAWRKNYYRRPGQAAIDAAVLVRDLA